MLTHLSVKNYALIDSLAIDFSGGLTIITGETGAGKSILLGALGLVAGNRADTQSLQDKNKKCIVEASFDLSNTNSKEFFEINALDFEMQTTIRREINQEGKSRAFINDTPVTLPLLKELTASLIDIHSQHETRTLNGSAFQLSVLDAFAGNQSVKQEYQLLYKSYKSNEKKLNELLEQELKAKRELDYVQFQFNELEELNLKEDEQVQAEQELQTLNNAETIKITLSKAAISLQGNDSNLISTLVEIRNIINSVAKYKTEIADLSSRINSTIIELKDIASELENMEQDIIYNPEQIELLQERLDENYRLQQKHQVQTIKELIQIKDELSNQLLSFSSLELEIEKLREQKKSIEEKLSSRATKLSDLRQKSIPKIEKEIATILSYLAMPNAALKIDFKMLDQFAASGINEVDFLFTANKGSDFRALSKVASGGELSRLMLALKSLLANLTNLPTIIFDEIDTGVSGEVADKVGNIMEKMGKAMQVVVISHLPQIASKGAEHFFVYKQEKNGSTFTNIRKLNKEERIEEIAKMLSAGKPTPAAINNAKELLQPSK
jgi:DNA repair protein RecN (Recombination protein N)